jgi:hypothetical protein
MLDIKITRTTAPKAKPDESNLGFGKKFTDHMFVMDYTEGEGWHDARIVPYGPFELDPATVVFHYAQEIFEGMKAYRTADDTVQLFRPDCNAKRFQDSADRLCIPKIPVEDYIQAVETLVDVDRDWVPHSDGASLYIRPFVFANDVGLGVHASKHYIFCIICAPSGAYYAEASNPATYTPTAKWDATGGKILKDLEAMIRMLTKRGLRASDLVCSPDVADTIINDAAVQKLLDNRRIEIGNVEPELLPDGAAIVARLNVLGRIISVISYDLTYTDDEGNDKLYIPSGKCVLTAPGAGRTAYGAVSQVEQSDGEFHTYAGRRVPKYVSSAEGNSRTLTISSRPLMIPNNKNPFIVADVLTD